MTLRIAVHLTDNDPDPWVEGLRAVLPDAHVEAWKPGMPATFDHAVVWAPPQQLVDEQPQMRGLFNIGAGVDALLALKLPSGMRIVRVEDGGMAVQMAEYVCHALIRHFRGFDAYQAEARQGHWRFLKPLERADFPVGILGLGVLGQRVASAVGHFDFAVNGWSRSPKSIDGVRCFAGDDQFDDFLAASRVLVNLLPLTDATRGILNRRSLSRLQRGGYLINLARGGHLVEEDLIPLIDSGQLAGATLDVFQVEPLPQDHSFWRHPKIDVTPHASGRTIRSESIAQIVRNMQAMDRGEAVVGWVDPARGY
ncbi:MAG: glyoxylate/hydroxypyruvate reductase A [Burkholderiaceae bacterium]